MNEVRLRDTRRANWFWVQNVLIDVFQPVIGPLGVTVYNALCRMVRNDVVDVTLRELGESATVSKDTAQRMLGKMLALNMVGMKPMARGRKVYVLHDLEDAAGNGTPDEQIARMRKRLAEAEKAGALKPSAKSRQEAALDEPGLFDEPSVVSQGDKVGPVSVSQPETSCLKTGGVLSQKEGFLSQISDPYLMLVEDKTQMLDKTLPNPPVGREPESLKSVLDDLQRLKPGIGDVSDLRLQIAERMEDAGFEVRIDARVADRGDGRPGTIDLWCERGTDKTFVGIECDAATPRERSLMKLKRIGGGAHRILVLRTAPVETPQHYLDSNIRTIALGWPSNKPEGADRVVAAARIVRERAMVGAVSQPATLQTQEIGPESVRQVFATLREKIRATAEGMGFSYDVETLNGLRNPLWEWDEAFGTVRYRSHDYSDAPDSEGPIKMLRIASLSPELAREALHAYRERIDPELARAFGCAVQVEVVPFSSSG